jgi:hypothetical protein
MEFASKINNRKSLVYWLVLLEIEDFLPLGFS